METKKRKLGIDGKTVDITNIADKSLAQFRQQLKQNGVVLSEERLESVYNSLHESAIVRRETEGMDKDAKRAYMDARYPERAAERARIMAEAKAQAEAMVAKVLAEKNANK